MSLILPLVAALGATALFAAQDPAPAPDARAGVSAASQDQPPSPAKAGPHLELETLAGETRARASELGPLTSLTAEGVAFVRFAGRAAALPPSLDATAVAEVTLVGGDRVRGVVSSAGAERLDLDLGGAVLPVSIDGLASVVFPARIPRASAATPAASADADVLYVTAGQGLDRAEGLLEELGTEGVVFEDGRAGRRTYAWARVAALFIAPLEAAGDEADEADNASDRGRDPVVVGLEGGGRLSGRLVSLELARVVLARSGGVELVVPGELVVDVALADGSYTFLSDLAVADGGPVSLFGDELGFTWPHRVDRAVDGGPLTVAGREETRGIGVHAPSRLTWRLDGGARRLRFAVGVDDSGIGTERSGAVRFRVHGDARELWASGVVRAGQAASAPITLDLAGVRELALEVDPEGDFVLDRANWLRPLLVRGEG